MTLIRTNSVKYALHNVRTEFLREGRRVDRGEWQGKRDKPQNKVFEIHDVAFRVVVPESMIGWQAQCEPNLPWAEDHFQERIGGEPLNPGEQYKNWPWYEQGVEEHKESGQFSHTYMERFWPKFANSSEPNLGIRNVFGGLTELLQILQSRPMTRQAYLPIWFPEDLEQSVQGERVPCTLGYHFIAYDPPREGEPYLLRATYFMRSCDWFRYLRDDMYMAGRLLQWVAEKVGMQPTLLTMHIANLHIFEPEVDRLRKEHEEFERKRLADAF